MLIAQRQCQAVDFRLGAEGDGAVRQLQKSYDPLDEFPDVALLERIVER